MIQVHNLTKRFGRVLALDGVSFSVERGETVALLGPNGSGKTTTLKCLAGLVFPSSGEIVIEGVDAFQAPVQARKAISYLPQRVAFPDQLTGREVLTYFQRIRNLPSARAAAAIEQTGLGGAIDRNAGEFSGGMMQRLGIAVALLADAPILLLDEPTANLDPESASSFRRLLASLKDSGKTILFSSHVLSDVEFLADRVAILVEGRLRGIEPITALLDDLSAQSILRVRLRNPHKRFCSVAEAAGATRACCTMEGLTISAPPQHRYNILLALERDGAEITTFFTVEPSLEDVYLRYLHEDFNGHTRTHDNSAGDGVPNSIAAAG
jgi:Cu-processing system ATP-binding protein